MTYAKAWKTWASKTAVYNQEKLKELRRNLKKYTKAADEAAAATLLQVAWRLHKAYAAVHAADAAVHAAATKLQRAARRHLQGRCNKPWRPSNLSLSLSLSLSPRLKSSRPLCQPTTGRCRSPRSCSNACRPLG